MIITMYCDGACSGNPGPGGYAAVLECKGVVKEFVGAEELTTNQKMELRAVIHGLGVIKGEGHDITIYTDSKYVVDGMNTWIFNWKRNGWKTSGGKPLANLVLWIRLDELARQHKCKFVWVKGHSGNPMNERANTLAQEAIRK
jgi:ribonuclease HI